jgi:hypothetical protein
MDLPAFIRLAQNPPPLQFLIIGGHAVAAHGHTRSTFDVDFLVRQKDRPLWTERATRAGLTAISETASFIQFAQESKRDGLDVMFVNDATFDQLSSASVERPFGDVTARIPSVDHLLALKLHALKQGLARRTSKDAEDVEMLARRNNLDLAQAHYEQLFLKYGTREIYETILRILRQP